MKNLLAKYYDCCDSQKCSAAGDVGLLLLRLGFGLIMAFGHGYGKVGKWMAGGEYQFADPIGLGVGVSLFLAGSAEFFAALLVAVGFLTRLAAIPVAFTMGVAFFIVHAADPFARKEMAMLYLVAFAVIALTGPGRFSLDHLIRKNVR